MPGVEPYLDVPYRELHLGPTDCEVKRGADGSIRLRLREALRPYPRRYTERLLHWSSTRPDHVFMARRPSGGSAVGVWETLDYRQTHEYVLSIGQALLDRRLSAQRPVVILSENDLENQLPALACMHVGIPYVPVTPAYSLIERGQRYDGRLAENFNLSSGAGVTPARCATAPSLRSRRSRSRPNQQSAQPRCRGCALAR